MTKEYIAGTVEISLARNFCQSHKDFRFENLELPRVLFDRLCGIPPILATKLVKDVKTATGSDEKEDDKLSYAGATDAVQKKGAKRFKKDEKISFQKKNVDKVGW